MLRYGGWRQATYPKVQGLRVKPEGDDPWWWGIMLIKTTKALVEAGLVTDAVGLDAVNVLPLVAEGRWDGRILDMPRGSGGFGYDPVFYDHATGRTAP